MIQGGYFLRGDSLVLSVPCSTMMTFLKHGNIPVGCVTLRCHQMSVLVGAGAKEAGVPCLMSGGTGSCTVRYNESWVMVTFGPLL